jgi:hypothetical protein
MDRINEYTPPRFAQIVKPQQDKTRLIAPMILINICKNFVDIFSLAEGSW